MPEDSESEFLKYLSIEEHNLLVSITMHRDEFHLFYNMDKVYMEPLARFVAQEEQSVVVQLFLFVRFHLYFSISCLLRCHLSEAVFSTRKDIDAGLSAYKIILEPDTAEQYLSRDRYFQNIKRNMQNEINRDTTKYPLAHSLIGLHDFCSEHGAHADDSSFFHRLERKKVLNAEVNEIVFQYFQFPRPKEKFKFYYVSILEVFFLVFMIFKSFLDNELRIIDLQWEEAINMLETRLPLLRERYHSQMEE